MIKHPALDALRQEVYALAMDVPSPGERGYITRLRKWDRAQRQYERIAFTLNLQQPGDQRKRTKGRRKVQP